MMMDCCVKVEKGGGGGGEEEEEEEVRRIVVLASFDVLACTYACRVLRAFSRVFSLSSESSLF